MIVLGQLSLLMAFAAAGYAAFACIAGVRTGHAALRRGGRWAGCASVLALTVGLIVLGRALLVKDFRFAYVAQYSSRDLPWPYALSALWVGQSGSLLLWAWMLGVLSLTYDCQAALRTERTVSGEQCDTLSVSTFGFSMAYVCFLTATMVFAADPMEPSVAHTVEGSGLSPLLQHPAMLIHPPVVFLGYAAWAIPCALTIAALLYGEFDDRWFRQVRPWALFAWAVLGIGILLGAHWSYEELGWGGYWAWDPVENASLIPWLTGTAFLHTLMAGRSRGVLKKSSAGLAVATFGLCNFATFLTRSGIFSSLHAFSRSPLGWLFLALMIGLGLSSGLLILLRRARLAPQRPITSLVSGEAMVSIATVALVFLAAIVIVGTLFVALSEAVIGRMIEVGPAFYNNALISTGLVLLAVMASAPLLSWGKAPGGVQRKALVVSAIVASLGTGLTFGWGTRQPLALSLVWITLCASDRACREVASWMCNLADPDGFWKRLCGARRHYAGFMVHLGILCLAIGVTGSSLGTQRHEFDMVEGETVQWSGCSIHFARLVRRDEPDKRVVEAELAITPDRGGSYSLRPAQHGYNLQNIWTTEAAIHSTWSGDFYTILHNGEGSRAHFTFVINPLVRWMWLGGWVVGFGVLLALWPESLPRRNRREAQATARGGYRRLPYSAGPRLMKPEAPASA